MRPLIKQGPRSVKRGSVEDRDAGATNKGSERGDGVEVGRMAGRCFGGLPDSHSEVTDRQWWVWHARAWRLLGGP